MKHLLVVLFALVCILPVSPVATLAAEGTSTAAAKVATINVNTATVKELESLPGIGKATADNIVAYRTEKGKFTAPEDLLKVKGIGEKTLAKIRGLVSVQ